MAYTTINKSSLNMNPKLYAGNGGTNNITGVGFKPDLVWTKQRTDAADHRLYDIVRGVYKQLPSNTTAIQETDSNTLTAFGSDGFSLGSSADANQNAKNFVSWNWKAGGAASSNTNGSITSSVSANTTAGFSIVSYTGNGTTGATIGHGLGKIPTMMIVKNLNRVSEWTVYHKDIGNTHYLELNSTIAKADYDIWHDTTPTANVFYARGHERVNYSGDSYIAYIFTDIQGYSKFGSYVGNSNADGPFVYTGFKPAFVLLKSSTSVEEWAMFDNKRLGYNPDNNALIASSSSAEATDNDIDLLSNGFKLRRNTGYINDNGKTYIYMAFGQSIVGSNDTPATAR